MVWPNQQKKICTVEPCYPDKTSFHTNLHTDQPDRKLTYFTFLHTYTYNLHTHVHILTLLTRSHSFSPIQSCANLCKNKSTPLDSLCDVCAFCTRVCVESSGITPSYCECMFLSSRGRGLTKSTFSLSEGCKCAENERNSSADSTRVQYRPSQRHLYYSQTGGPYNTTHTDMHCNHLEIYSTNQATQEIECKHANTHSEWAPLEEI